MKYCPGGSPISEYSPFASVIALATNAVRGNGPRAWTVVPAGTGCPSSLLVIRPEMLPPPGVRFMLTPATTLPVSMRTNLALPRSPAGVAATPL